MKERVESLETQLALIKADLVSLKTRTLELPDWVRTTAVAILFAVFAQTITAVWWASNLTTKQEVLESRVAINTNFREGWHAKHSEVMNALQRVEMMLKSLETDNKSIQDEHKIVRDRFIREGSLL